MQQPLVAGVAGGVGTTTLAMALRTRDCGIYRAGAPVDVLVARATLYSLGCAQRALVTTPAAPVLAVVAAMPGSSPSRPVRARLRMTEAHIAALVLVPFVPEWVDCVDPYLEAGERLGAPAAGASKALRGFDAALHTLIEHLTPLLTARSRFAPPTGPDYGDPYLSGRVVTDRWPTSTPAAPPS